MLIIHKPKNRFEEQKKLQTKINENRIKSKKVMKKLESSNNAVFEVNKETQ